MALTESGIRFKVEGEDSLARAIKTLDSSLKALDKATLKATTGFGDLAAAAKRANQIENLSDKIKIQNNNLTMLQEKLAKTAAQYGENSDQAKKVQSAIDSLSLSIKQNQQSVARLNQEEEQSKKNTQENIAAKGRAADAAGKAATAVADLRTKLEQESDAAKKSGNSLEEMGADAARATGGINRLDNVLRGSHQSFNAFREVATGAMRRVGEFAVEMAMEVGRAFIDIGKSTIKLSGDYEATMNRFAAVAGDSIAAAGLELETFDKLALKLGADTQFSAQQAADALVEGAKAGIEPAALAAGSLEAILNLATAGELGLGKAAEITAKQLGAWANSGIEVTEIVDLLSQAANVSTLNVEDLALGTYNAGGVARAAGLEYKEFVATLSLMSSFFASGAETGTALKSFLQRIVPTTGPATAAFKDLGLITKEGNNVFYDAQGQFAGMANVATQLKKALDGLTEKDRTELLKKAFGTYGVQVAIALAEQGPEALAAVEAAMDRTGAATDQAALRQKGFNFALETLKGSLETIQIVVGRALLPAFTSLIKNALIPAANAFLEMFEIIKSGVDKIMKVGTTPEWINKSAYYALFLSDTIENLGKVVDKVFGEEIGKAFRTLSKSLANLGKAAFPDFSSIAGAIQSGPSAAISFLANTVIPNLAKAIDFMAVHWEAFSGAIKGVSALLAGAGIAGLLIVVGAAISAIVSPIGLAIAAAAALGAAWETNFGGIQQIAATVLDYLYNKFLEVSAFLVGVFAPVYAAFVQFGSGALAEIVAFATGSETQFQNLTQIVITVASSLASLFYGVVSTATAAFPQYFATIARFAFATWSWIVDAFPEAIRSIGNFITGLATYVAGRLPEWLATLLQWGTAAVKWIGEAIPNLLLELSNFLTNITSWGENTATPELKSVGSKFATTLYQWIQNDLIPKVGPELQKFWDAMKGALDKIWEAAKREGGRIAKALIDGIVGALKAGASQVYTAVSNLMSGTVDKAEEVTETHSPSRVFARIGTGLVDGLIQGLQSQTATGAVSTLMGSVVTTSQQLLGQWVALLAKFGEESWMWAQRALPFLKMQMLAWGNAVLTTLTAQLPNFTTKLALWTLEAWKWLQLALAPLQGQMLIFTSALMTWANTIVLLGLKISATGWAKAAYMWIPQELMPGIQPYWSMFLSDSLARMKLIEEELFKAGRKVGQAIVKGIVEGMLLNKHKIINTLIDIITEAVSAAKQELGIASPSKVFFTLGEQIMAGMSGGIADGAKATARVLTNSIDGMIPSAASMGVSITPDLSPVNLGAGLGTMNVPNVAPLAVDTSMMSNLTADLSATRMIEAAGQGGTIQPPASGAQIHNQRAINNSYSRQNNYNLTVNSPRESQGVVNDFYVMEVVGGGAAI